MYEQILLGRYNLEGEKEEIRSKLIQPMHVSPTSP